MDKKTIAFFIESLVSHYNKREALVFKKEFRREVWSYNYLYNYAHSIAGFFKSKGLKKGDKIIIYSYNSPEYGAVLLSCAISGVIAVPLDYNSNKDFVHSISKKVNAKLIFSSKSQSLNLKNEIFIEDLPLHIKPFQNYRSKVNINEDDIFEIVYTSGTTSDPKGVVITNKNLVSNINSLRLSMPLKDDWVFLSIIPLSHLLEQTLSFFVPLRFGCKIVYTVSRRSSIILEALQEEKVTSIVAVPALLNTLKDKVEREVEKLHKSKEFKDSLNKFYSLPLFIKRLFFRKVIASLSPSLKFFVVGGAPLDINTEKFWNSLGILVLQGYGLTETSPILTCNTFSHHKEGTVGRVIANQELKVAGDGEIICKGNNVTQGYYNNIEATNAVIKNGWFYTGDLGEFDKEGFLILKGRKKNMILSSSGLNVYPEDIEKVINSNKVVKDSVVLGIKSKNDVIITAVIIPKINHLNTKNLLKDINSKLPSHQQIQKLVVWKFKDFPRTPSLKIKRNDVEKLLKVNPTEDAVSHSNKLFNILASLSNISLSKIKHNSVLSSDLAIDSIHRVELVSRIEEEFNVELEESKITPKTSVSDLSKLISESSNIKSRIKLSPINSSSLVKPLRYSLQSILFASLRIFYSVKVFGKDNLKHIKSPVIFAVNHTSHLDTPTIISSLPSNIRSNLAFASAEDYFFDTANSKFNVLKKFKTYFLQLLLNIFPFSRTNQIKHSIKLTGKLLDKGFSVVIYPEGTRSLDGKMAHFKTGIGLIASNLSVPVIPVKIKGLFEIMPKGKSFPSFGKVEVHFGKPLIFSDSDSYIKIAESIETAVKKL